MSVTTRTEHEPDLIETRPHGYGQAVHDIELLTPEEERDLTWKVRRGEIARARLEQGVDDPEERARLEAEVADGRAARSVLIERNLRLVHQIARSCLRRFDQWQGGGIELDDLCNEGVLGLIRAAEKFEPERNLRFSTYAHYWINQAITSKLRENTRGLRIPSHARGMIYRMREARSALEARLGREPTIEELAAELEMRVDQVKHLLMLDQPVASLDAPVGDDQETELADMIEDANSEDPLKAVINTHRRERVWELLEHLSPIERQVIAARFGFPDQPPRDVDAVARDLRLTRHRVRMIEAHALRELRRLVNRADSFYLHDDPEH
jgi:RNA polymerase primary sigma factor